MREPIETEYFKWLCAKVLERGTQNYVDLLFIMYKTEFVWVVPADRNREEDGIELRLDYLRETFQKRDTDYSWYNQPCSILEVLVAFAKRASFQTDIPVADWFHIFLENLKLDDYRRVSESDIPVIEEILYNFVWRTYDLNGDGGLFPMLHSTNNQKDVEIWYQFCEYLEDRGLL